MDRLKKLEIDLCEIGKQSDFVYLVRRDVRIKTFVERRCMGGFKATAELGGETFVATHTHPRYVIARLVKQLRYKLDQMAVEANPAMMGM